MYRALPKPPEGKLELIKTTKIMLKYGLPLSIGAILSGFLTQFYSTILYLFVTNNSLIGNYSVSLNFVVLITFFATPVTTMLFPAFSKLDAKKEPELLQNVFQYSVKYATLVVVPVTTMIMALAQPAINTIFEGKYEQAPFYLALSAVTYLLTALGSLSVGNLINSQGYTRYNLKLTLLTVTIGFPLSFVLISQFGIVGLIVTSLIVGLPSLFLSLHFIKKNFGVSIDWKASAKIMFSSSVAAILTYFAITQLPFDSLIRLVIGVIIFVITALLLVVITRTINKSDIENIRQIVNALGPLRKPLVFVLNIIEKLMVIFHNK